jgi:hypothetical protein
LTHKDQGMYVIVREFPCSSFSHTIEMALALLGDGQSPDSPGDLLWHHPAGRKGKCLVTAMEIRPLHSLLVRLKVTTLHLLLLWNHPRECWDASLHSHSVKAWASHLAFAGVGDFFLFSVE